jgi:hypothetical protein
MVLGRILSWLRGFPQTAYQYRISDENSERPTCRPVQGVLVWILIDIPTSISEKVVVLAFPCEPDRMNGKGVYLQATRYVAIASARIRHISLSDAREV